MSQVVLSAEAFGEAHTQVTSRDLGPLPQGQWGSLQSDGKAGSREVWANTQTGGRGRVLTLPAGF